jgi:hypothetical protein
MGKSDLVQKVGGTNTLLVPGSQKLGGTGPLSPHGGCAYDSSGSHRLTKGQIPLQRLPPDKLETSRACLEEVGFQIPSQRLPRVKLDLNSKQTRNKLETSLVSSRQARDGEELRRPTTAVCYNDSAFAIAVLPSFVIAVPTVLFSDTVVALLSFQGESSLCRARCQIPLQRAN